MSEKITFDDLTRLVSDQLGVSQRFAKTFSKELVTIIRDGLKRDGKVNLSKLGIFELKDVEARQSRDPETGETITIPAHQKVVFKPYKSVRKKINAPYEELEATFATNRETPATDDGSKITPSFLNKAPREEEIQSSSSPDIPLSRNREKTILIYAGISTLALLAGWGLYRILFRSRE